MKLPRVSKKSRTSVKKKSIIDKYKAFCYRLLEKPITRMKKSEQLQEKLKKANLKYTPETYLAVIIVTGTLVIISSLLLSSLAFLMLFKLPSGLFIVIGLTCLTGGLAYSFLPFVVRSRISSRKIQIEMELPFVLSELSILASTGLTPIKIMRHMAERKKNTAMESEFKKVVYKIDVEGKDIITAVSETAKETPSPAFREMLWDFANMIHQGGDLDVYLRGKADMTLQVKRDIQKEFIEKLSTYSEMYVSLVLIGIIMIGIAAFLLNAMGTEMMGLNADTLLQLLSFAFIPIAVIFVNVLLSMAYSKSG